MVFRMMSEFCVSFLPHLWGEQFLQNEGSCMSFWPLAARNSLKQAVNTNFVQGTWCCRSGLWHSGKGWEGCVRWINERMACRSRAAFLHRGVGLPVIVYQCALEKSICKSAPGCLYLAFGYFEEKAEGYSWPSHYLDPKVGHIHKHFNLFNVIFTNILWRGSQTKNVKYPGPEHPGVWILLPSVSCNMNTSLLL